LNSSPGNHSAIFEIAPTCPVSLRIRCIEEHKWLDTFQLAEEERR